MLFSEDSAILNSGHHEVISHVILVQIQLYKFNRSRTYKRCPFSPWGSMYALLQRFFKTQNKMKPKRINSWLLCFQGNKCKTFIDELRDSSRVILSGLNFCFKKDVTLAVLRMHGKTAGEEEGRPVWRLLYR